jgi:hypothetical protein
MEEWIVTCSIGSLEENAAIVTGGAMGIDFAIAKRSAESGRSGSG